MHTSRTHISSIPLKEGETVLFQGAVETIREKSKIIFLILRDISGSCQAITYEGLETFDKAKQLTKESIISALCRVKLTEQTKQGFELELLTLDILSKAQAQLPIPIVEKGSEQVGAEAKQDWRFLAWRRQKERVILKALSALDQGYRTFLLGEDFIEIHTPKLMATPSESRGELFSLDYFGKKAYLAQSPQLFKQMAISAGLERVFEIAPAFRAELSLTTRHATEFISHDIEMAYIQSVEDILQMAEKMVAFVLTSIRKTCGAEMEKLWGIRDFQLKKPIPRLTMAKAKSILQERGQASSEADLTTAEEKAIGEYVAEHFKSDFVFITEFPVSVRPFYHKYNSNQTTASADLIYKGVEVMTLAQREECYETLLAQAIEKQVSPAGIDWYLDCFRYGCPPHGGWGFGSSRFIKQLFSLEHVKEASFLYRGPTRISP